MSDSNGYIYLLKGTKISPFDWNNINKYRDDIQTIMLPKNIHNIPDGAFMNCTKLRQVYIYGDNVILKKIGKYAFKNCTSLSYWQYPTEYIDSYAFYKCCNLSTINTTYKNCLITKTLGENAFDGCVSLERMQIDNMDIKHGVFDNTNITLSLKGNNFKPNDLSENTVISNNLIHELKSLHNQLNLLHSKHDQVINMIEIIQNNQIKEDIRDSKKKCLRCEVRHNRVINNNTIIIKPCNHMLCEACYDCIKKNNRCFQCQSAINKIEILKKC